ncbi:uncharacterized protein [Triticum aestivum]|uniref:uncharacterized protein n=1 Tax=Triticum aestivum TaxID=4565 RepID=UPI001D00B9C9|nr:uncharacterized protein LOC123153021 [Triticum aestivum]
MVLLKLKMHAQSTMVKRTCLKISFKFFGPFKIAEHLPNRAFVQNPQSTGDILTPSPSTAPLSPSPCFASRTHGRGATPAAAGTGEHRRRLLRRRQAGTHSVLRSGDVEEVDGARFAHHPLLLRRPARVGKRTILSSASPGPPSGATRVRRQPEQMDDRFWVRFPWISVRLDESVLCSSY